MEKDAIELRKHLKKLSNACLIYLRDLDIVMKLPSSEERGIKIARLANDLEMANDRVRYFALGVNHKSDRKQPVI